MSIARCAIALAVGVTTVALAGCGDKYGGRVEVAGNVKFKGQPLNDGIVIFEPLGGGTTGATTPVKDGAYKVPRENGLKPGKYLIRITSGDIKNPVNAINPDEPPGPGGGNNVMAKERLPADWNTKSKQEREVTSQNPNKIDFDIP